MNQNILLQDHSKWPLYEEASEPSTEMLLIGEMSYKEYIYFSFIFNNYQVFPWNSALFILITL